jgi:predicted molibdopterin-dependent oxidoreductase YjgC
MFTEQEGTFTNHAGRVQRFWPGIDGPGAARPAWLVLGALLAELTEGTPHRTAEDAFVALGGMVEAYRGLSYADIGQRGALANEPLQIAGD